MTFLLLASNDHDGPEAILPGYAGLFPQKQAGGTGDRRQVVEVYDELRPAMYGYLCCLGLKPQESEDIIQDTFLRLFEYLAGNGVVDNVRAWSFRVGHNLALNLLKARSRLISSDSEEMSQPLENRRDAALNPEESLIKKEHIARIAAATLHLTPQQKQCLYLRVQGLRYREIGLVLGVSRQRIADLVQNALASMAGDL